MSKFLDRVINEFLETEPPHLALVRAAEAVFYKKYLPFKGRILDVGCGDGFFAWSVYERQKIDNGVDVEGSLWREAALRGNYGEVVCYDGGTLPFDKERFETVVSNCVLEHIPNIEKTISEMARVCKKGGKILVTVVTDKFGDNLLGTKILGKSYKKWFNKKSIHVSALSEKEWLELFEKNGLKLVEKQSYLDTNVLTMWHDVSHYWGVINLVTRKLLGKWVWGPSKVSNLLWKKSFEKVKKMKQTKVESPYLFLAWQK